MPCTFHTCLRLSPTKTRKTETLSETFIISQRNTQQLWRCSAVQHKTSTVVASSYGWLYTALQPPGRKSDLTATREKGAFFCSLEALWLLSEVPWDGVKTPSERDNGPDDGGLQWKIPSTHL